MIKRGNHTIVPGNGWEAVEIVYYQVAEADRPEVFAETIHPVIAFAVWLDDDRFFQWLPVVGRDPGGVSDTSIARVCIRKPGYGAVYSYDGLEYPSYEYWLDSAKAALRKEDGVAPLRLNVEQWLDRFG